jgi:hypothetical protein
MTIIAITGYNGYKSAFNKIEIATNKHYFNQSHLIDITNAEFVVETINMLISSYKYNYSGVWDLIDIHRVNKNFIIENALELLTKKMDEMGQKFDAICETIEKCFIVKDSWEDDKTVVELIKELLTDKGN